ncbi:MAG: site-specific integrase [Acidobacteria bacterium]|nr:site-specific integrase [Acidobacteriota bacterium]
MAKAGYRVYEVLVPKTFRSEEGYLRSWSDVGEESVEMHLRHGDRRVISDPSGDYEDHRPLEDPALFMNLASVECCEDQVLAFIARHGMLYYDMQCSHLRFGRVKAEVARIRDEILRIDVVPSSPPDNREIRDEAMEDPQDFAVTRSESFEAWYSTIRSLRFGVALWNAGKADSDEGAYQAVQALDLEGVEFSGREVFGPFLSNDFDAGDVSIVFTREDARRAAQQFALAHFNGQVVWSFGQALPHNRDVIELTPTSLESGFSSSLPWLPTRDLGPVSIAGTSTTPRRRGRPGNTAVTRVRPALGTEPTQTTCPKRARRKAGPMALYKRGATWWFQFKYSGRRYQESAGTSSKTLARTIERVRRQRIEEASHGIRKHRNLAVLFPTAATNWLPLKKPTWAANTYAAAMLDVKHLKKHFGNLLLADIKAIDVAQYITCRRKEKAAEKTLRNECGSLRSILGKLLWSQLQDDGVSLPSGNTQSIGFALSAAQETAILKACARSRSRSLLPFVTLLLSTGMRSSEVRLLRWNQIDFTNTAIRVGRSKTPTGTGRAVHLNTRALAALRNWGQEFPERKGDHFVFPSEKVGFSGHEEIVSVFDTDPSTPITSWKASWTTARATAGVRCRFHDLRHTAATRLLEAGEPIAVVAEIMGWSPATATRMAKLYGHIGDSARRRAMTALEVRKPTADAQTTDSAIVPQPQTIQ